MYGKYVTCLQCGYLKDVAETPEIEMREPMTTMEERKAA
jgi:hypothetical protein